MIPTIAALLVLAPSVPEGQWGATSMTAAGLASKVDGALASLTGVTMHFVYVYSGSLGYGVKECEGTFVSPTKFRVEVPAYNTKKEPYIDYETWVSDGKQFGSAYSSKFAKPQVPASRRPGGPAHPLGTWFGDCSRAILSGAGQPTHPFERFVADAKAAGYSVAVQERHLTFKGRVGTWYRLVVAKGAARYETVFDATGYLPVNVINTYGPKDSVHWYEVRWNKPKTLDTSSVKFIKPQPVKALSPAPRRP